MKKLDRKRNIILRFTLRKLVAWAQTDRGQCRFVINKTINGRAAEIYRNCLSKCATNSFTRRTVRQVSFFFKSTSDHYDWCLLCHRWTVKVTCCQMHLLML
jgi:hypothetical protein